MSFNTQPPSAEVTQPYRKRRFSFRGLSPYLFILPFFILFAVFFLFPSLAALILSLFRWDGISELTWMGTRNYDRIFSDRLFWQTVRNTLFYTACSLLFIMPASLILATLLNAKTLRFATLWRLMYFTPIAISSVATSLVFQILFNENSGLINAPLIALGMEPINWLGDRFWVRIAIVIVLTWQNMGLWTIYFLAGLQSVPPELFEAAEIDGANKVQQFTSITIPLLRPIILFVSILVMLRSIQIFDIPNILTEGGPANASMSVVQYLYSRGFERLRFGFASSVGTVLFAVVFVLSLIQLRFFGAFDETTEA